MTGIVDSKFLERFGSAVLLSVVGGAAQFVATLGNPLPQQSQDIRIVDPVTGAITIIPGMPATRSTSGSPLLSRSVRTPPRKP